MSQSIDNLHPATNANLAALCVAMRAKRIAAVTIAYAGGGDSGQSEGITATDAAGAAIDVPTDLCVLLSEDNGKGIATRQAAFEDVFDQTLWDVIRTCGHDGWENGEGGQGELTLTADGVLALEHGDNYVETTRSDYALTIPTPPVDPDIPSAVLSQWDAPPTAHPCTV